MSTQQSTRATAGDRNALAALGVEKGLLVSGESLFAGYWRRPEATRRALRGKWYRTGDKFRRHADGFYWSMGRTDDLLRVSGHWVSPGRSAAAITVCAFLPADASSASLPP